MITHIRSRQVPQAIDEIVPQSVCPVRDIVLPLHLRGRQIRRVEQETNGRHELRDEDYLVKPILSDLQR